MSKRMSKDRHSIYVSRRAAERERSIARKRERATKWFEVRAEYLAMGGVR